MLRIFCVLAASLALGAGLAWNWAVWPGYAGIAGAIILMLAALLIRRHWDRRQAGQGDDPGAYEKRAWHSLVSLGVLAGHLITSLGSGLDLHVGQGNTLAIDNWALTLAAILCWFVMRPRSMTRDERDQEMINRGARSGFRALVALLIMLLLTLGFAPVAVTERLSPFVLGNVLVVLILLGWIISCLVQLLGYWAASRPEAVDG